MSSKKFADTLASRSPLVRREAVEPVNMYTNQQVDKTESGQTPKDTNGQTGKTTTPPAPETIGGRAPVTTSPQTAETTSGEAGKTTKPQVEKYTTHLRPATIKAIKRTAVDRECKDYEIVQQALDAFLRD